MKKLIVLAALPLMLAACAGRFAQSIARRGKISCHAAGFRHSQIDTKEGALLVKKIVSFGFRHGPAPVRVPVLDVRKLLRNPYSDRRLRALTGTHPDVQAYIEKAPDFAGIYADIKELVSKSTADEVWIGCMGGHHRSVYLVHRLAEELRRSVEHRDIAKS